MESVSDEQLATWCRRLRNGDRAALEALFRAFYPALVRYARSLTQHRSVSAQDAFIRLWQRRAKIDPERSVQALLYMMVRHRALNRMRNATNRADLLQTMDDRTPLPSPDDAADAELLGERLRGWIDELPERRREAFRLSRFDGLSYREIADVMEISARTVENHIRLALKHLRDRLHTFETSRLRPLRERTPMSRITVAPARIASTPMLLGETDVLKTLQLLPGVKAGMEGTSGL